VQERRGEVPEDDETGIENANRILWIDLRGVPLPFFYDILVESDFAEGNWDVLRMTKLIFPVFVKTANISNNPDGTTTMMLNAVGQAVIPSI